MNWKFWKITDECVEPKPRLRVRIGVVEIEIEGLNIDDAVSVVHSFLDTINVPKDYIV